MLTRQYCIVGGRKTPLPISAIIQAANRFICEIYICWDGERINAKSYDEVQRGFQLQRKDLTFYFDGADEKEADVRFRKLFEA